MNLTLTIFRKDADLLIEVLDAGQLAVAKDGEEMRRLNALVDALRRQLRPTR